MLNGNVEIIRDFHSDALNADHRVFRVYLPPDYDQGKDCYPVVYLHDGQWMFACDGKREARAANTVDCCAIDLAIDALIREGQIRPVIMVAIDCDVNIRRQQMSHSGPHFARRMGRRGYVPCFSFEGNPMGFQYQAYVADEVKPYVDSHYRTLPQREHTLLAGSSMGGLVSLRMGMYRPEVFGMLGLQSPAVHWETDAFYNDVVKNYRQKIWLDCGTAEAYYVDNTRFLLQLLCGLGYAYGRDIAYSLEEGASHCAKYFEKRFAHMMLWFFGESAPVCSCEIFARDDAAVAGHVTVLNTRVRYQNGMVLSDMAAEYRAEPAGAVRIEKNGEVHPLIGTGTVKITCQCGGQTAEKTLTLKNALSRDVILSVTANVPADTPPGGQITYQFFRDQSLPLERCADGKYRGFIGVPRDWCFDGYITRCQPHCSQQCEVAEAAGAADRRIQARENVNVEYTVKAWAE